jgi:Zn finger protein HypA/HybF involved in hydrogenase expression
MKTKQTTPKEAICDNCGKVWMYKGINTIYVTCPNCRKMVKLDTDEEVN